RDWIGPNGEAAARIAKVLPRPEEGQTEAPPERVVVVPLGGGERRNVGITGFAPVEKLALAGVPLELEVRVANWGDVPVRGVPLALESGEGRVPLPAIGEIPPGEEVRGRHRTTFLEPGARGLSVRLA